MRRKLLRSTAVSVAALFVSLIAQQCFLQAVNASPTDVSSVLDGKTITRILARGNVRVEDTTVIAPAQVRVGARYDSAAISRDVKEIFKSGFFEQVTAKFEPDGTLVFQVVEKPAVRKVKISGSQEVEEDKVRDKLNIGARFFLDRRKIDLAVEELRKFYQSEGFYGTVIGYNVEPVEDNQVDLAFAVQEGEKKRIVEIVFEGVKKAEESELRDSLSTARYRWWVSWLTGSGVVKEEELESDVRELNRYYLNHGFVDARVSKPVVQEIKGENDESGLRVVYHIEEGEIFSISEVSAEGDLVNSSQSETLAGIETASGDIFNLDKLRKDTFTVSEKFTDKGYAFANVEPATNINRDDKTVGVKFVVDKGKLVNVNRINITGNKKTKDNVIRRSLQLGEQELFSSSKVRRSQELLQRLGYFDEVTITPEPIVDTGLVGSTDSAGNKVTDAVDLGVNVKEGNTGSFSVGAGISSGDGFIFSSRISENNIFGSGNSLTLDLNTGSTRENYVLSFTNPRVDDSHLSLGADLLSVKRQFDNFDRSQLGGSLTAGYPLFFLGEDLANDYKATLTYDLQQIEISDVDEQAPTLVKESQGQSISSSVTPQLIRNTIDNPLDPSKGSRQQISVELAGIGGDEKFWLAQAANTWYYPAWKSPVGNFIFSHRVRFGYGETFGDDTFPLFKRFFPGGINSVRGYESRELGPKDENGDEYGGSKQLVSNFELIYPLVQSIGLSGVVFYDVGNAFDDETSIKVSDLRLAFGWGIRWRSPLAPIRLEFGYPINRQDGESAVVTNFSFGAPQ